MQGDMQWMERTAEKRLNPQLVLPGARSVIMLGVSYWAEKFRTKIDVGSVLSPRRGRGAVRAPHPHQIKVLRSIDRDVGTLRVARRLPRHHQTRARTGGPRDRRALCHGARELPLLCRHRSGARARLGGARGARVHWKKRDVISRGTATGCFSRRFSRASNSNRMNRSGKNSEARKPRTNPEWGCSAASVRVVSTPADDAFRHQASSTRGAAFLSNDRKQRWRFRASCVGIGALRRAPHSGFVRGFLASEFFPDRFIRFEFDARENRREKQPVAVPPRNQHRVFSNEPEPARAAQSRSSTGRCRHSNGSSRAPWHRALRSRGPPVRARV